MAAYILKLGSLDLSDYVRIDEQVMPYDGDAPEPQFVRSPLRDGGRLSAVDLDLEERAFPLFLSGPDAQVAHDLQVKLTAELLKVPALLLEWHLGGVQQSTFYDVEFGRFEPEFEMRRSQAGWHAGTLRLFTQPYGHFNTTRLIATAQATNNHVIDAPIASGVLAKDVPAVMQAVVTSATGPRTSTLAVAALPHPSYLAQFAAPSFVEVMAGATQRTGFSGAANDTALSVPVYNAGATTIPLFVAQLPIASVYGGRNRCIGFFRKQITKEVYVSAKDHFGNAIGATQVVPSSMAQFFALDLGVLSIPDPHPAGPPIHKLRIYGGVAASSGFAASPGFHISDVVVLPEDSTVLFNDTAVGTGWRFWNVDGIINRPWLSASGAASTISQWEWGNQRGAIPQLAPGPGRIAVLAGSVDDGTRVANDAFSVTVSVKERVRFAR